MKKKIRPSYIQEPLFEEFKKDICYVCHKWIKDEEGLNVGNGLWRHLKCNPIDPEFLKKYQI